MTARDLLDSLAARDIVLVVESGKVRLNAPKDELTAEDIDAVRQHKVELIELVTSPAEFQLGDPINWDAEPELIDCEKCQRFDCWWDATGRRRCLTCDPPTASRRWLAICEKIRAKRRKGQR